jgi:hypothetical protein
MGEHVIMARVCISKTRSKALGISCALALLAGSALPAAAAIGLAPNRQGVVEVVSATSDEQRMRTLDLEMGKTVFWHRFRGGACRWAIPKPST